MSGNLLVQAETAMPLSRCTLKDREPSSRRQDRPGVDAGAGRRFVYFSGKAVAGAPEAGASAGRSQQLAIGAKERVRSVELSDRYGMGDDGAEQTAFEPRMQGKGRRLDPE